MAENMLQSFLRDQFAPERLRAVQSIDPNTGLPVEAPIPQQVNPNLPIDLAALGGDELAVPAQAPVNLLEGTPYNNVLQQTEAAPQQAIPVQQEQTLPRRSFLSTIGGIADVLAKVGGAEALYQPTVDAAQARQFGLEDRERAMGMQDLQRTLAEQQIEAGGLELGQSRNQLIGQAVRGAQAIQARGGDLSTAWPILARQAGIDDQQAAELGQIFAENPDALQGFASMLGQQGEFGLQPFYARGADGQLQAYQLGKDGSVRAVQLGEGETPIDPLKFVDTGGSMVGVGSRSGQVQRVLPRSERPGSAENRASRENIAAADRTSRENIAATRGAGGKGGDKVSEASKRIADRLGTIKGAVNELDRLGAIVKPGETGANISRRARASGVGQLAESFLGTETSEQRQLIRNEAVAIVSEMKEVLGLTGTMMDRPQEFDRFIAIINDPTTTHANMIKALDTLERQYGSALKKAPSTPPVRPRGGRADAIRQELQRRRGSQ